MHLARWLGGHHQHDEHVLLRQQSTFHHQQSPPIPGALPRADTRLLPGHNEDREDRITESAEEGYYSATMFFTVKDLQRVHAGSAHNGVRVARVLLSHLVLWVLIFMQVFLLMEIKAKVCSPMVASTRKTYDEYERTMYDGRVKESGYGFALGMGGPDGPHFRERNFKKLSEDFKSTICQLPFSQPEFLGIMLLIWALTCAGEIRAAVTQCWWLYSLPSMPFEDALKHDEDTPEDLVIAGLPISVKVIGILIVIPRMIIACVLCWLGCRWLASTPDFVEVLNNSVALQFVMGLNDLLYGALMSDRNKREMAALKMNVKHEGSPGPSPMAFLGALGWGIGSFVWVYLYMYHLQMVLPGYQWDVRGPCAEWSAKKFSFWRI